ncbi:MAG: formylglycine-generating enzyme family protein, partial [Candidatus Fermentibacteria bacterium]|nr:formylglycine-generating enzyme family protein [Candidatus Fermentibacteria bacterium]
SNQDGNILYGLNSRTGEQLTIVGSSTAISIAAHRVWGHPSDRTVIQPAFSGKRTSFSEFMEAIYTYPLKDNGNFLPAVKPYFLRRIEEMKHKPIFPEMEFVQIPSGEFLMGLAEGKSEFFDEPFSGLPVRVAGFEMLSTPVTVEMWSSVTNQRPEGIQGDCTATDWANWHESMAFARVLSSIDSEFDYRLPTEAEWEYACRAGTTTEYYSGNEPPKKPPVVLEGCNLFGIRLNSPVGTSLPNPWGLFDMGELVSEWCIDSYNPVFPLPEITSGLTDGGYRVVKGGARSNGMLIPASWSDCSVPWIHSSKENGTGFRLIRTPKKVTS